MVTEPQVQEFFGKWNRGEINKALRLGQAFINHFHLDCNARHGELKGRPCLFHDTNNGRVVRRIWEEWVKV